MSTGEGGAVVWLTGIPASGKSTIARHLVAALGARGTATLWLDSDDMRRVLTPDPRYTAEERDWFYGVLGHLATLAADGGTVVVVSATAPRRVHRDAVRARAARFLEAWVRCPPAVARDRDPKGLYEASRAGRIDTLPGVGAPYEEPKRPEIILDTDRERPEDMARRLLERLERDLGGLPSEGTT